MSAKDDEDPQELRLRQEVAVLGDQSMTMGFRLAGVRDYSVVDAADQAGFDAELARMLGETSYGLIIASEPQLSSISPALAKRMTAQMLPIVIGMRCKGGCESGGDQITDLIQRTLGIVVGPEG